MALTFLVRRRTFRRNLLVGQTEWSMCTGLSRWSTGSEVPIRKLKRNSMKLPIAHNALGFAKEPPG
jgi:hypothetical protein